MTTILKVRGHIRNPMPSIDAEKSCK